MPQEWTRFLAAHFQQIWLVAIGWVVVAFTFKYFWHRSKERFFEDPPASAVLYSESFASGRSLKSWRTRWGGASNCLKVMLTGDRLFVRPLFPFLIFGPDIDLVHSVPFERIESAVRQDGAFQKGLRISFQLADGAVREIDILSKKPDQFESALAAQIRPMK